MERREEPFGDPKDNVPRDSTEANQRDRKPRAYGLCQGEFVVPDDFDDPLPEEILRDFEGR